MWDHFKLQSHQTTTGFDFHGHSGLTAVSYVIRSELTHEDSQGNVAHLPTGSVQLLVAGSGALHRETLTSSNGDFEAFQLWTALPKDIEMGEASYQSVPAEQVPMVEDAESITKVLVGEYCGVKSSVKHPIDMNYFHVLLKIRTHVGDIHPLPSKILDLFMC